MEEEGRCRGDRQSSVRRSPSPSVARVVEVLLDQFSQFTLVATYPSVGGGRQAHGCAFQERKMRGVATNVYLRKTSEKLGKDVVYELLSERFGSCIYARGRY